MPRSRRTPPTNRIEGWNLAAKQKVMPASSATRATPSGDRSRLMPSFSSTSEEPLAEDDGPVAVLDDLRPGARDHDGGHRGDVDRLGPVAARADDVDGRAGDDPAAARGRTSPRTRPVISSTVSPLARRATMKPGDLGVRGLAAHDPVHRPGRVVGALVLVRRAGRSVPRARNGPPRCRLQRGSQRSSAAPGSVVVSRTAGRGSQRSTLSSPGHGEGPRPMHPDGALPRSVADRGERERSVVAVAARDLLVLLDGGLRDLAVLAVVAPCRAWPAASRRRLHLALDAVLVDRRADLERLVLLVRGEGVQLRPG